jgi:hypothetical protein
MIVFNSLFINAQEWAEEEYPTYANGPGYIISSDIAKFIVSNFEEHTLKVCSQMNLCYSILLYLSFLPFLCTHARTCIDVFHLLVWFG